jgi:hypothetical protein
MLFEIADKETVTWVSVLAILMPLVVVIVRHILSMSKTQKLLQKTGHQDMIDEFAEKAIGMAEKWATNSVKNGAEKPSSDDKKKMAVDFLLKQAKEYGIPQELLDSEVLSGIIESFLSKE